MRVLVASTNPVKIEAARRAAQAMFGGFDVSVTGIPCPLDLPAQPWGKEETRDCALQRARFLESRDPSADLYIGMEGGVQTMPDAFGHEQLYQIVWIVILDRHGLHGEASASSFPLPGAIRDLMQTGAELGDACDTVFGDVNSKQKGGTTGFLTDGALTRLDLYTQPTVLALTPFRNRPF